MFAEKESCAFREVRGPFLFANFCTAYFWIKIEERGYDDLAPASVNV